MKLLSGLLLTSLLITVGASNAQRKLETFDFESRIGIAVSRQPRGLCLSINSNRLAVGERVRLVIADKPQNIAEAVVVEKLTDRCFEDSVGNVSGVAESHYVLRLMGGKIEMNAPVFALVGMNERLQLRSGMASIDLDGDKRREHFRMCASHEGLHMTVWSGEPTKGTPRWHRYYYLQYDVEPTCTDADYFGSDL